MWQQLNIMNILIQWFLVTLLYFLGGLKIVFLGDRSWFFFFGDCTYTYLRLLDFSY
jgi:hypothetical protein